MSSEQSSADNIFSTTGVSFDRWVDLRMISTVRLVLATAALLITMIDPTEPDRFVAATYAALALYAIYSLVIYILALRRGPLPQRIIHWLDLAWYVPLIALSSGTNSIFFFFLFFCILVASFGWGFREGLRVTVVAATLFVLIGMLVPADQPFQWHRFLLRPLSLLVLGYMIAQWGGFEVKLKRRLALLKDLSDFSDPRFGLEQTVDRVMHRLSSFYGADSCMLVVKVPGDTYQLRKVSGSGSVNSVVKSLPNEIASILLSPSPPAVLIFHQRKSRRMIYDFRTSQSSRDVPANFAAIGNTLEAKQFMSLPVYYHGRPVGRFYVIGTSHDFNESDIAFLLLIIEHVTPVLDNIRLVDRLASE